jgi:hypothetical protein
MAKSIILGILMETLGEYVDLSKEKLKMAVWSGEIALRDLSLKSTAFASLDLPVHVLKGSLGSLKVTIPWTNLGKSSTVVQLDDIIALIGPSDDRSFTAEDLQRHSSELKRKILEKAEKIAYAYISSELNKKELDRAEFNCNKKAKRSSWMTSIGVSYIQGIVAKVLANVEIKIRNIHFRYEDSSSVPGSLVAAGLTVDELLIVTTDDKWIEKAHTGIVNKKIKTDTTMETSMFKIATLRNLAIYWDINGIHISELFENNADDKEWLSIMKSTIYSEKNQIPLLSNYILLPPNLINIKLAHNTDSNIDSQNIGIGNQNQNLSQKTGPLTQKTAPRGSKEEDSLPCLADLTVDMGNIYLLVERNQLEQSIAVLNSFAEVQRQRHLFLFRPADRPSKDPRAWWVYAYKLLTGRDDIIYNKAETMKRCLAFKYRYKQLISQTVTQPAAPVSNLLFGMYYM